MNDDPRQSLPPAPPAGGASPPSADTVASSQQRPKADTVVPPRGEAGPAHVPMLRPAQVLAIPGYEILCELGRGGMGVVYKARQLKLNRIIALKMVLNPLHADARELIRFLAEAEAVAAIKHPNVVQVYDSDVADGRPFMTMELLEGGSLVTRLRQTGKLEPRTAAELVLKLARGVQAAHEHGIIHRDLKPHNVLLDAPPTNSPPGTWGEPKVTDFGLAKRGGGAELTQTGAVMGTPAYMAPEQAMGGTKNIGPAADVYALGVILYECLTGSVPFTGEDPWAVIRRVITEEAEPVSRRVHGIPRELDLICRKCMEKAPADRYPNAGALADDLQRFLSGEAIRGPRTDVWYVARRTARRWWRPVAALAVLAAIIFTVAIVASRWMTAEDPLVKLRREEVMRRVDTLRELKPNHDREPAHAIERTPSLPPADMKAFKIINDERIVDLRGWKPNPNRDPNIECVVVYQNKRDLMKIHATSELRIENSTSGRELIMRAIRPNAAKVKALAAEKLGFVGQQAMKIRQLVFDVSDIPLNTEFTLQYVSTYHDSLQEPEEWWFGAIGYEGSFKTSMLMLFPENRPFRDYALRVAAPRVDDPSKRSDPVPYTGPVITFAAEDKSWLYWEIPSPKAGYVYRVDWTW